VARSCSRLLLSDRAASLEESLFFKYVQEGATVPGVLYEQQLKHVSAALHAFASSTTETAEPLFCFGPQTENGL
jgi:hypothetical protein